MNRLFNEFQEFRRILCVCPCCGDIVRVSDLRLKVKGPEMRTWLDDYEGAIRRIERSEERFEKLQSKIRDEAVKTGQRQARRVIQRALMPIFKRMNLDPLDIKPILNPVDFIAFKGMNRADHVSDILFMSKKCESRSLKTIRAQIDRAVEHERYNWQVARINEYGKIEFEN
jgi:predicted Holliday junction resolvase-like endonuclease